MSETSLRRRLAGRLLLGVAVLALPLTASISYAESEGQSVPEPPTAPEPPAAPQAPGTVPEPPAPPAPPPLDRDEVIVAIDPDTDETHKFERETEVAVTSRIESGEDGKDREVFMVRRSGPDGTVISEDIRGLAPLSKAQKDRILAEVRSGLAEADAAMAEMARAREAMSAKLAANRTLYRIECEDHDKKSAASAGLGKDMEAFLACERFTISTAMATAREALEKAREQIARDRELSKEMRDQIIEDLDRQIERVRKSRG